MSFYTLDGFINNEENIKTINQSQKDAYQSKLSKYQKIEEEIGRKKKTRVTKKRARKQVILPPPKTP